MSCPLFTKFRALLPKMVSISVCLVLILLVTPLHTLLVMLSEAIFFIICADIISHYILHGKEKSMRRTQRVSLLLMPTFAITLYAAQDKMSFMPSVKKEQFMKIVVHMISVSMVMLLCKHLKVFNNQVQVRKMLKKSKYQLGPGLARAFFSFLEMLAKREFRTPGLQCILANYEENEYIQLHPKVFILLPRNTSQDAGSHSWMFQKEKKYNKPSHLQKHGPVEFTFQGTIVHQYFLAGKNRDIDLAVIKILNTQTRNVHYVAIAENRPMITLQKMKNVHSLKPPFSEEEFQLQSEIYKNTLGRLIEEDEVCRDMFEIVDMQADNGDFTIKIYNKIVGT